MNNVSTCIFISIYMYLNKNVSSIRHFIIRKMFELYHAGFKKHMSCFDGCGPFCNVIDVVTFSSILFLNLFPVSFIKKIFLFAI